MSHTLIGLIDRVIAKLAFVFAARFESCMDRALREAQSELLLEQTPWSAEVHPTSEQLRQQELLTSSNALVKAAHKSPAAKAKPKSAGKAKRGRPRKATAALLPPSDAPVPTVRNHSPSLLGRE